MNGIMNENQLTFVKEYEFDKPLIHMIDSIIDNCIRDCHRKNLVHLITFVYMILKLHLSLIMNQLI